MSHSRYLNDLRRRVMLLVHPDIAPSKHAELNTTFVQQLMNRLSQQDVREYKKNGRILSSSSSSSSQPASRVFVQSATLSIDLDVPVLDLLDNLQKLTTKSPTHQHNPPPAPPSPNSAPSNEEVLKQFEEANRARLSRYHKAPPSTHSLSVFLKNVALEPILHAKLWTRRAREQAREFTRLSGETNELSEGTVNVKFNDKIFSSY